MKKRPIKERREEALYKAAQCSTDSKRKEILTLLLAIITNRQIKEVVEELSISIKKE